MSSTVPLSAVDLRPGMVIDFRGSSRKCHERTFLGLGVVGKTEGGRLCVCELVRTHEKSRKKGTCVRVSQTNILISSSFVQLLFVVLNQEGMPWVPTLQVVKNL